jgi:hypothetical protein
MIEKGVSNRKGAKSPLNIIIVIENDKQNSA